MMGREQSCNLQILIASGPENLGRAVLGFAFALAAAASGANVTVILTLQGVVWLDKDVPSAKQSFGGFLSIGDYMDMLKDRGVVTRLCSSCLEGNCKTDIGRNVATVMPYIGLVEIVTQTISRAAQTVVF
jgi:predicted peroxiredoxin